jgi:GNAT superfamily N-acetyltransferase
MLVPDAHAYHAEGFIISTNPARLDVAAIHGFLAHDSYWARNIPCELLERAIANSLNFGLYAPNGEQAGFARVVTDKSTFAWLCDVFVLPAYRGRGLSKWLMKEIGAHPDLQGLRRRMLATLDAHSLYEQFGFVPLAAPERFLEIRWHNPYGAETSNQ